MPDTPWRWRQSWHDLLFAHWPVRAHTLQSLVPPGVEIEEFDGTSWVGVVPFHMSDVMRRGLPGLPWVSAFPEINLRLYVRVHDRPGVWFVSLDAANPLAVWTARRFFRLPYCRADMAVGRDGDRIRYSSVRRSPGARVAFRGTYWPTGTAFESRRGTIEHFLTERYCLYARAPGGEILVAQVHHLPWPLQPADADIEENTIATAAGIDLVGPPPLLHFSRKLDVAIWSAERVRP